MRHIDRCRRQRKWVGDILCPPLRLRYVRAKGKSHGKRHSYGHFAEVRRRRMRECMRGCKSLDGSRLPFCRWKNIETGKFQAEAPRQEMAGKMPDKFLTGIPDRATTLWTYTFSGQFFNGFLETRGTARSPYVTSRRRGRQNKREHEFLIHRTRCDTRTCAHVYVYTGVKIFLSKFSGSFLHGFDTYLGLDKISHLV